MDKNEEKYIEHHSNIDDVFAFAGFRRYRKLGKRAITITQKKWDDNKPADGDIVSSV